MEEGKEREREEEEGEIRAEDQAEAEEGEDKIPPLPVRFVDGKEFGLPEGWTVELRPRYSLKYIGKIDQFFYEPQTRRQFRSLKSAKNHAFELEPNKFKSTSDGANSKSTGTEETVEREESKKRKKKNEEMMSMDMENPPESVMWVLSKPQKSQWNAYFGQTKVPNKLKQHWIQTFSSLTSPKEPNL